MSSLAGDVWLYTGLITSLIEDAGRTQVEEGSKTVCGNPYTPTHTLVSPFCINVSEKVREIVCVCVYVCVYV